MLVSQVLVAVENAQGKIRFWRNQPSQSHGFGPPDKDSRETFSETHNNIYCFWSAIDQGSVLCEKANWHGYTAGLTGHRVLVFNEENKVVYLADQP